MNNYKRITMREFAWFTGDATYNHLAALEDKIESGELAQTVEVVKECLQVLRAMRMVYIRGYYVLGWNDGIDEAIERLAEKYCIDEEEEK